MYFVNKNDINDLQYVKSYFYDKYDLTLSNGQNNINIDIKTAETMKTPTNNWNFLYSVIQAHKKGKDLIILCYYVKNSYQLEDLKKRYNYWISI